METLLAENLVRDLNARFEKAAPEEIVRWALQASGLDRIAIASAFQLEGTCLIHMAIRKYKPTTPGRRGMTGSDFAELGKTTPQKALTGPNKKRAGRNAHGRHQRHRPAEQHPRGHGQFLPGGAGHQPGEPARLFPRP